MKINAKLERISNGFIATFIEDSPNNNTGQKVYYPSLPDFVRSQFEDEMRDMDRSIKEHDSEGSVITFNANYEVE